MSFSRNLLSVKSQLFDPPPQTVIYFYKVYQPEYDLMKKDRSITFINELPQNVESFKSIVEPYRANGTLVCFDDYEQEIIDNISFYKEIWTIISHHFNVTPIAVLHNLFAKQLRTISLNTHRVILTKSLRDSSQISFLSRQCYPHIKNFLPAVYQHCITLQDYPYLIMNFTPGRECDNYIKVSTRIFEHERPMVVFRENPCYKGSSTGNPYEKLILLNENVYKILSSTYSREESFEDVENLASSKVNNTQNLEINNISGKELTDGSTRENESEERLFSNSILNNNHGDIQASPPKEPREVETFEGKDGRPIPFSIPPMRDIFKRVGDKPQNALKNNNTQKDIKTDSMDESKKFDTLKKNHKDKKNQILKRRREKKPELRDVKKIDSNLENNTISNEGGETDKPAAVLRKNVKRKISSGDNEVINVIKKSKVKDEYISKMNNNINSKRRKSAVANRETHSYNESAANEEDVKDTQPTTLKKHVKRRATPKINRSIHPFKKRRVETDIVLDEKRASKRKKPSVVNREIHPYKALKLNRGEKRKLEEESSNGEKHFKDYRNSHFKINPTEYYKWNI